MALDGYETSRDVLTVRTDSADPTNRAHPVILQDADGNYVDASAGGGTEYDVGTTTGLPSYTGTGLVFNNSGTWAGITEAQGLPVNIVAGGSSSTLQHVLSGKEVIFTSRWEFDSTTTSGTAAGEWRKNAASATLSTIVYISQSGSGGANHDDYLTNVLAGDLMYIRNRTDPDAFELYEIQSIVNTGSEWQVGVTSAAWSSGPTPIADADDCQIDFYHTQTVTIGNVALGVVGVVLEGAAAGSLPVVAGGEVATSPITALDNGDAAQFRTTEYASLHVSLRDDDGESFVGVDGGTHGASSKGFRALGSDGTDNYQLRTDTAGRLRVIQHQAVVEDTIPTTITGPIGMAIQRNTTSDLGYSDGDAVALTVTNTGAITSKIVASLPSGTNNIGDVDVLTLPALPAGSNNIGDVDVLTTAPPTRSAAAIKGSGSVDFSSTALTNGTFSLLVSPSAAYSSGWIAYESDQPFFIYFDGDDAPPGDGIPVPSGRGILNLREILGDDKEINSDIDLTITTGSVAPTAPSAGYCAAILY